MSGSEVSMETRDREAPAPVWLMVWKPLFLLVLFGVALWVFNRHPDWNIAALPRFIVEAGALPFFAAMAVLPVFGFPTIPLLLLAGSFGLGGGLLGTAVALLVNLALSYSVGKYFLRGFAESWFGRYGRRMPSVPPRGGGRWVLLLRVTPALPQFAQSYLLALGGVRFSTYMLISWPVVFVLSALYVVFGEFLLTGRGTLALTVGLLLAVILVALTIVRSGGDR